MNPSPPPPIVPTPAVEMADRLRGRRVIVGVPGVGFRDGLRADDVVVRDGRTYVPVLTEQDYYRVEIEEIEAIAPLVPIDRVWVELALEQPRRQPLGALDAPPVVDPSPVLGASVVVGRRVVQAVPDGFVRDLRAVSQVYVAGGDRSVIRICAEHEWYRWGMAGTPPATTEVLAGHLWLE